MAHMGRVWFLVEICSLLMLAWANPRLLFANRRDIRIIDAGAGNNGSAGGSVGGRDPSQVVIGNLEDAAAVDYLHSGCIIFWTDVSNEMIKSTYCNGTQEEKEIITTGLIAPDGLACDWVGMKIYWTDSETNRVEVSELDGGSRKVLFWQDLDQPRAIALDPENGYLYWTDWGEVPKIERAGMDGTYRTTLIDDNIFWPNGLTIDYGASKLYWADAKYSYIHSANTDGTNRQVVIQGMLPHPFALTLFDNLIYWTDWETKSIHTCDKITGGETRVIHDELYSPMDIHVYDAMRQQQHRVSPCAGNNGGCSHLCLMAPEPAHFACACPTGVKLLDDGFTCADGAEEILLLARRRDIRRISLDTEDYTDVVLPLPDILHAIAIDYDPIDGFIYWTDDDVKAIRRAKPDGSESEYIVTSDIDHPDGVAVDWIGRNIYWTATGTDRIEVARLNGTSRKILVSEYLDEPRAIAVDPAAGYMYWTDWGQMNPKIERAFLDGTNRQVLVNTTLQWPNGLALDFAAEKIYWGDGKEDRIEMADMDGRNRRLLVSDGIPHIFGFTLLGEYVYWTDWQKRRIERVNKNTGLERQIIKEQLPDLMGLKAVNVKVIIGDNPCSVNNGDCSHLCLYRPQGHICACPMGHELLADQRTCIVPEAFLLFSLASGIWRISLETSHNNNEIPLTGVKEAVALDFNDGMVYWSDTNLKTISRAYMNGTGVEYVIEFGLQFPEGIAVDWVAHNIYFTDTGTNRIEVARLDGSGRRAIVWQDVISPRSIAINPAEGFMYFSDWGGQTSIERAYMDGSHRKVIVDMPGRANGLTIDYGEQRLYWTAIETKSIESSDLFGTTRRQIIANELEHPFSMTQYGDFLYFADWETRSIDRVNKSSGENRSRIQNDVDFVMDILVMHSSRQEGWNLCAVNNGGCEHLCLSHPNSTTGEWDFVCGCPTHYTLNLDGKTCTPPESFFIYGRRNNVNRMTFDIDESPDIMLPIHTVRNIRAIEFDPVDKQLYWIDNRAKTVRRVNESGIEPHTFIRNPAAGESRSISPYDIAIEPYSRMLFWTCSETNVINVTRLDGKHIGVVISGDNERPRALTLIPERGLMFWTNLIRNHPKIERANLDGTEHKMLFSTGLGELGALAADYRSNKLYWVDNYLKRIETADISGANRKTLVSEKILNPVGLGVFGDFLYWADRQAQIIARVDKLNGQGWTKLIGDVTLLSDIVMVNGNLQENHPCIDDISGCSHLCIAMEDGRSRCSCPIDLVLQDDYVTCGEPPTCTPDQFACESGTIGCVPLSWLCDEQNDCDDGSDEIMCPYCEGADEFKCSDGQCILASQRCDNRTNCENDEHYCYGNCQPDQYRCANLQCLDKGDARCDGVVQCRDGSDESVCGLDEPDLYKKGSELPSTLVGALVAVGFIAMMVFGFVMIWRRCRIHTQNAEGQYDAATNNQEYSTSTVLMLNQLSKGSHYSHKYLSGTGGSKPKTTNLHKAGPKSQSSSSNGYFERNHPTGASSCSSEMMSSSGNSCYPKETLNPPPSPVTIRSQCTAELYYTPQSPATSRSYRHYKMRNIPPPPTPCSTDVCEDSEPYANPCAAQMLHQKHLHGAVGHHFGRGGGQHLGRGAGGHLGHHHHHQKHMRRKKGKYYTNVSNLDLNYDSEPYPPPPTPRSQLSDNNESCPPSPSTERSFFNPYPPPPSPATDST